LINRFLLANFFQFILFLIFFYIIPSPCFERVFIFISHLSRGEGVKKARIEELQANCRQRTQNKGQRTPIEGRKAQRQETRARKPQGKSERALGKKGQEIS